LKKVWDILFVPAVLAASVALLFAGLLHYYRSAYPMGYQEQVETWAAENQLDPALVYAVIRTESSFNPEAMSSVGARGLMQLTPDTYEWVCYRLGEKKTADVEDLYDPEENIRCGCANLRLLLGLLGEEGTALAAYHAGLGNVSRWLESEKYSRNGSSLDNIPFSDTEIYVNKVLETRDIYRRLYPSLREGAPELE
jgi:soluble lytic murein transglycosylase